MLTSSPQDARPRRVDFRRTFLRHHVAAELGDIRDLLALGELRTQLRDEVWPVAFRERWDRSPTHDDVETFDNLLRLKYLNPRTFFYGASPRHANHPDLRLYTPVAVVDLERPRAEPYPDLTALLRRLDQRQSRDGVLLTARSGAGKTVAQRKAFCDCAWSESDDMQPALAGLLPCWLRVEGSLPARRLVEHLLLDAAGLRGALSPEKVGAFLGVGPKLLIFCDLNAVNPEHQLAVATALKGFQQDHGPQGHRCVVAYRSTQPDDHIIQRLGTTFSRYDLRPLGVDQAVRYLRNVREFEASVYDRLREVDGIALPQPRRDIDKECAWLEALVRRHVANDESLISTPLLMHFVSLVKPADATGDIEEPARVETLSHLYAHVVQRHVERDRKTFADHLPPLFADELTGPPLVIAAMTRLALALVHRGPTATRLSINEVQKLLTPRLPDDPATREPWWPSQDFWLKGAPPYYAWGPFENGGNLVKILFEFSLLRRDGKQVGFLHDSLIYYLAGAVALRQYRRPDFDCPLDDPWNRAVIDRLKSRPEHWELPIEFLGGSLNPDDLQGLTDATLLAEPAPGLPDLLHRLLRGGISLVDRSPVLKTVIDALRLDPLRLRRRPAMLFQQCFHQLWWSGLVGGLCRSHADRLRVSMAATGRPWLRQLAGPSPARVQTMAEHSNSVNALAVLGDGRVVSGGDDKTVKVWDPRNDPDARDVRTMADHAGEVRALAVLGDGRVVSGGDDKTVKVWDPRNDPDARDVRTMAEHSGKVVALAVLGDGRVVSGGYDNTVKVWDPGNDPDARDVRTMAEHSGKVVALAVLGDGRVVSGGTDDTVRVWDPRNDPDARDVRTMAEHSHLVEALAVLGDGRVVSGSWDKTVKVWDPRNDPDARDVRTMAEHSSAVSALAVLGDGRVVSVSWDNTVKVWDPRNDPDARDVRTMAEHSHLVEALAVLGDGRVVSGSWDKTVKVWDPRNDPDARDVRTMAEHSSAVSALAVLGDGRVVSGGDDKTVKVWDPRNDPDARDVRTMAEHSGKIMALAVLGDGRVVSGSWDSTVRVWDPRNDPDVRDVRTMAEHSGEVRALAVLGDGRVVSGSTDDTVRVWDPRNDPDARDVRTMAEHSHWVRALAVLGDGRVVSGSDDKTVKVWDPRNDPYVRDVRTMAEHSGVVRALAVLGDGRVVSGGYDNTVKVWDPGNDPDARDVRTMAEHSDKVVALAVLGDGRVVSGGDDKTVKVWDPRNDPDARDVRTIAEHTSTVTELAVLGDGRVVSMSDDGFFRIGTTGGKENLAFFTNRATACLAIDVDRGFIYVGLGASGLMILRIEP